MNFSDLQTAVMSNGRFGEQWRLLIQQAINQRYAWVWAKHDDWVFRTGTTDVTVTSGSQTVTNTPADLGSVYVLLDPQGNQLLPIENVDEFQNRYYNSTSPLTGLPEAFTVYGTTILVGPTPNTTSSAYRLVYSKTMTPLTNATDIPTIPTEHHLVLADGASAVVYRYDSDYRWSEFEQMFAQGVAMIENDYLVSTDEHGQYGSWENRHEDYTPSGRGWNV